jgi:cob(I)alamin adenosyltransferase
MKETLGLTQIYWGNGKGKTTSALGTALRATGNNFSVHLIQFMKGGASSLEEQIPGEIKSLEKFPNFTYKRFGSGEWVTNTKDSQIEEAMKALKHLNDSLNNPEYNIIIADEILYAIQLSLISESDVIELIKNKPQDKELILTGSHIPFPDIFELADLVTEIKKHKHPYDSGIQARKGIEY